MSISSLQSQPPAPADSTSSLPSASKPDVSTPAGVENDSLDGSASGQLPASTSAPETGTATSSSTPPASGASTPTKATQRKSRAFLDLAPLTGFLTLRGRYAATSQKPSVKSVAETPDAEAQAQASAAREGGSGASAANASGEDGESGAGDDEDDRRTIRGVSVKPEGSVNGMGEEEEVEEGGVDEAAEGKVVAAAAAAALTRGGANGIPAIATSNGREKVVEDAVARSPPLVLSS